MKEKSSFMDKFINGIEIVGNKLPHPFLLFIYLWLIILVLSQLLNGISAIDPVSKESVSIVGLLNREGFDWILKSMIKNYVGFSPMGTVLTMMLGLGIVTHSGLLNDSMGKLSDVSESKLTYLILLIGICGNIASGAASAIIPSLSAMLFYKIKKNPIFGLCIGFAGVTAGFTSNLMITGTDVLTAGITTEAINLVNKDYVVDPTSNWYFMIASTIALTTIGGFFINKVLMPKYGKWDDKYENSEAVKEFELIEYNEELEKRKNIGLRKVFRATVLFWGIIIALWLIPGGPLRDIKEGTIVPSLFISGIIPLILIYFAIIGTIYGKELNTINNINDFVKGMESGLKGSIGFFVIAFPISQAIAAFGKSNIATVMAINIAEFFVNSGINKFGLFFVVIFVTSLVNLFIVSGSSKWALLAPIFVPVMYYLGFSPELTQVLYRMGDSPTNIITPMQPFIGLHLSTIKKYDKDAGLGTIFSRTFPLSILFILIFIILFLIWYALGLPLGPGVPIR